MTIQLDSGAFGKQTRSVESRRATLYHRWLLVQYWWNETDAERFVYIEGKRYSIVAPPRFGRRNWLIKMDGKDLRVLSINIQRITGSSAEGLGK